MELMNEVVTELSFSRDVFTILIVLKKHILLQRSIVEANSLEKTLQRVLVYCLLQRFFATYKHFQTKPIEPYSTTLSTASFLKVNGTICIMLNNAITGGINTTFFHVSSPAILQGRLTLFRAILLCITMMYRGQSSFLQLPISDDTSL